MKLFFSVISAFLLTAMHLSAQSSLANGTVLRLWEKEAPGALGTEPKDIPTLTAFLPPKGQANGTVMVICPGGGYGHLADHEGAGYANYLVRQGITCFVLKYRLATGGYRHPAMWNDASRALRLVRSNAAAWGLNPARIGIMGSSAGGHLTATALTHFDAGKAEAADPIERASSRPDFGVLCYAVITMEDSYSHGGSKKNLLGETPDPKLVELLSNEKQVTAQTPPCFIWHTGEDPSVPVENSLRFALALQAQKVPYDLHVYQKGGHGMGLASGNKDRGIAGDDVHPWAKDLVYWLRQNGWLPAA